ncbi:hypothetical protein V6N13_106656 [Hibiscus sabdariffa]
MPSQRGVVQITNSSHLSLPCQGQSCSGNNVSEGSEQSSGSVGSVLQEANLTAEQDSQDRGCDGSGRGARNVVAPNTVHATNSVEGVDVVPSGCRDDLNENVHGGQLSAVVPESSAARSDGLIDGQSVVLPNFISHEVTDREASTLADVVPMLAPAVSNEAHIIPTHGNKHNGMKLQPGTDSFLIKMASAFATSSSSFLLPIPNTHKPKHSSLRYPLAAVRIRSESMATEKLGIKVETNPPESKLSQLGIRQWPKWGCPPSKFPWTYSSKETCYLLEGKVKVYPDGSNDFVEIAAGDLVVFPKGMSCTWEVSVAVDKHYKFD